MTYLLQQFGSSSGSFFEAKASFVVGTSLVSPREPLGSSLPPALTPHLFYAEAQRHTLHNSLHFPPYNLPVTNQMTKVSAKFSKWQNALFPARFSAKESEDQVKKLIIQIKEVQYEIL